MAATPALLRQSFPEFANLAKYPDAMVQMWLDVAARFINADRWGDSTDLGVMLRAAHHLVLAQRAASAAQISGVAAGGKVGIQTSKSVDGVSVSYDVSSVTEEGAGHFNMTTYGLQYVNLARLFGFGPVHIGADLGGTGASAWPGVIQPPF